jgi:hypothetical protein
MKTRIAAGTGLLLTLGTAMAGTLIYGQTGVGAVVQPEAAITATTQVTPEMIAMWRATAVSDDYVAPKVPL